jgi:hypothetical protein
LKMIQGCVNSQSHTKPFVGKRKLFNKHANFAKNDPENI